MNHKDLQTMIWRSFIMALTETELQDILGALTPEEQKQLFDRLGQTFSNPTPTENPI